MKTYAELFNLYKMYKLESDNLKLLLKETLAEHNLDYFLVQRNPIDQKIKRSLDTRINKLKKGIPPQHILGYAYFYGLKLKVNKNVLIPRFDTEVLVDVVLKDISQKPITLVDVGTGSGAIAIAIKANNPKAKVYATEINDKAFKVAKQNTKQNRTKVILYKGDLLKPLLSRKVKVDIIVSNPPYISRNDKKIESQVKKYEPSLALFSKDNGLYHIKRIIKESFKVLKPHGAIYLEVGYKQANKVKIFAAKTFANLQSVEVIKDLSGIDRVVKIKFK